MNTGRAAAGISMICFSAMKSCALLILLLSSTLSLAAEGGFLLSAEEWSRPRSGEVLRELPTLQAAMGEFARHDSASLVIGYPGGEEGVIWVQELRSWLIALGVPAERIVVQPGSGRFDALDIRIKTVQ